jgi:glycosyltransferase involved in cell wall biosynthesis
MGDDSPEGTLPFAKGKVLFCIATLEGGGAERQAALLAAALARRDWDLQAAVLRGGPNERHLASAGVPVERLAHRGHHDPRILLELRRVVRSFRPDVVHTWLGMMDVLGGTIATMYRIPWVASERGSVHESTLKERVRRRLVAARASVLVTNSEAGRAYVRQHMGRRVPAVVIDSGIHIAELAGATPADRAAMDVPAGAELVLHAGRFSSEKNVETLVRSVPHIVERRPAAIVICAGVGSLQDKIEKLAAELGVTDRLRFPGYVEDLAGWMRGCDLLVSASFHEGRPNVLLEAMAVGLPVVVSDIPAHRELVDEGNALLFDPRSPTELADAVVASLADREGARSRAEAARLAVARFDVQAMVKEYERVYEQVLRDHGPMAGAERSSESRPPAVERGLPRR